jgi:hypothetical protein
MILMFLLGEKRNNENQNRAMLGNFRASHEVYEQNQEFPCINFEDVVTATNNFSDSNMLGEGGFGKVYKVTIYTDKRNSGETYNILSC